MKARGQDNIFSALDLSLNRDEPVIYRSADALRSCLISKKEKIIAMTTNRVKPSTGTYKEIFIAKRNTMQELKHRVVKDQNRALTVLDESLKH